MLPRIADSLSFLYLESVRITQDDTGVCAQVEAPRGTERVYLPVAALSCLLLGPGTSITQPALATCARNGTTLVAVGAGGVRSYAGIMPASLTTAWLERQARAWADTQQRLDVATRMYTHRYGPPPGRANLAQLRGLEGQRVKALYRMLSQKHGIKRFRRNYDPAAWDTQDPVNLALSAANSCMYGIVHAAILALGCSPALGFIHSGTQLAFVYDIADLFKMQITVPLAFPLHNSPSPESDARRSLREQFRLLKLMPEIITSIQRVLDPDAAPTADRHTDITHLWDPQAGALPAGVNYADTIAPGDDEPWQI